MKKIPFSLALLLLFALAQLRAQTLVVDTFYYTGSTQTFVIPQCISNLTLVLDGAKGGHDPGVASVRAGGSPGGDGGRIYVVISPTPGALLYVNVGGAGQHYFGGWNGGGNGGAGFHSTGGGGGGASDIRIGGNTIANRIFVAGGGGGGGGGSAGSGALNSNSTLNYGGMGGGLGCTSFSNTTQPSCPPALGCGGSAGNSGLLSSCSGLTLTGSGANGGGGGMNSGGGGGTYTTGCSGTSGSLFQGGNGGDSTCTTNYMNKGRFGGGGGGGGYYGGGGGHSSSYNAAQILNWNGGGGGGSTYLNSSYVVSYFTYGWTGMPDGVVTFSYYINGPGVSASASQNSVCAGQTLALTAGGVNSYTWLPSGGFSGSNSASVTVSPATSTQYTVSGLNTFNCISQTVVSVYVDPVPIVQVSPAFPAICPGDSVNLTASGATWYSWSTSQTSSGIKVSPATSTVYSVTGSSTGTNMACPANASVQVVVYPVSPLNVVASRSVICLGEYATLNASGALSYTWSSQGIAPVVNYGTLVVSPTITTSYSVTGASINSCKTKNSIGLMVEACTHLSEQQNAAIQVFPNPSEGTFYVQSPVKTTLCIYASTGQLLRTETLEASETKEFKLDSSGIYYLLAKAADTVAHFKLVVAH